MLATGSRTRLALSSRRAREARRSGTPPTSVVSPSRASSPVARGTAAGLSCEGLAAATATLTNRRTRVVYDDLDNLSSLPSPAGTERCRSLEGVDMSHAFALRILLAFAPAALGQVKKILNDFPSRVGCVAFSPDGKSLATATLPSKGGKDALRLWDVTTGKELCSLGNYKIGCSAVVFS